MGGPNEVWTFGADYTVVVVPGSATPEYWSLGDNVLSLSAAGFPGASTTMIRVTDEQLAMGVFKRTDGGVDLVGSAWFNEGFSPIDYGVRQRHTTAGFVLKG